MNTWTEAKRAKNPADHSIDLAALEGFFLGDLLTREDAREAYGEPRFAQGISGRSAVMRGLSAQHPTVCCTDLSGGHPATGAVG